MSPDGRQIAFVGQTPNGQQIFVRAVDSPVARPVAGTEGGTYPAWAPDGRRLAFHASGKLRQVTADGGAAQDITDMANPRSAATWGPDDTLLYHIHYRQPLSRVPVSGGAPVDVLPAATGNVSWFSPVWLPDGRHFVVVRFAYSETEADGAGIVMVPAEAAEEVRAHVEQRHRLADLQAAGRPADRNRHQLGTGHMEDFVTLRRPDRLRAAAG